MTWQRMWCNVRAATLNATLQLLVIYFKKEKKKRMMWQLMWCNMRAAALNTALQLLVILVFNPRNARDHLKSHK